MTDQERAAMQQALEALEKTIVNPMRLDAITNLRAALAQQPEPAQEPVAWATEIIDALQAQYDTEMIQENDSGDALIRLDDAIAAVEDAEKHYTASPKPEPEPAQEPAAWMNPDDGRVIPAQTMQHAREGGGASLSSVRSYTVPLGPIRAQRRALTDEEILRAAINACDSLHITRAIYAGGGRKTICDDAGLLEICRAIERKVRGEA